MRQHLCFVDTYIDRIGQLFQKHLLLYLYNTQTAINKLNAVTNKSSYYGWRYKRGRQLLVSRWHQNGKEVQPICGGPWQREQPPVVANVSTKQTALGPKKRAMAATTVSLSG